MSVTPVWWSMTTLPAVWSSATIRHATDGVRICGRPMIVGTIPDPGCIRAVTVPEAPTTSTSAFRNVLTSKVPPTPTTTSRRSRSSVSVRVAAPPAAGSDTSSPPAQATWIWSLSF